MTAHPETRIRCDRCMDETHIPMSNTPQHTRTDGPEGWLTLKVGSDPSKPPSHLCPPCAFGFIAYMEGRAITTVVEGASTGTDPVVA